MEEIFEQSYFLMLVSRFSWFVILRKESKEDTNNYKNNEKKQTNKPFVMI